MSSSKYASLPDIDTAPDIYETPDVPTEFTNEGTSDSDSELQRAGSPSARRGEKSGAPSSENIDGTRLDAREARRRFGEASLRQPPREETGRKRYTSRRLPSTSSYSLQPPNSSEKETTLERLRRLRSEVEDLEDEVERDQADEIESGSGAGSDNKGKKKEVSPAVILQQLHMLRADLVKLSAGIAGGDEGVLEGDGERVDGNHPESLTKKSTKTASLLSKLGLGDGSTSVQVTKTGPERVDSGVGKQKDKHAGVGELELRVAEVERVLGASEADVDESRPLPPPLLQTIARLDHLLTLLTQPRHLDSISRRVKVLVSDLERLHESRRKLGDTRPLNVALSGGMTVAVPGTDGKGSSTPSVTVATALPKPISGGAGGETIAPDTLQKIDTLFSLLPRLDPLLPLTPRLLTRLRSLATLHSSAANFGQVLDGLRIEVERLGEGEKGLKQVLDGLEQSVGDNEGKVRGNLEGLEGRLAQLAERMDKLGL